MVTDIHNLLVTDNQPHHATSVQQVQSIADSQTANQDHYSHCGVCSYDHGGHMGQTLATLSFVAVNISAQHTVNFPLGSDFWYSRSLPPKLRPPIA